MAETITVKSAQATAEAQAGQRRWKIILVGTAVALYWSSLYFYVPTLGIFAEARIGDLALVGAVLSMYGLVQAIVRLPLGIAADWLGQRKPFILAGLALAAAGALLMSSAGGFAGLAAGRAVTGLAAAAWVPLTVLFSSLFPPKEAVRATSLLMLINSFARVVSTSLTGFLNNLGGYGLAFTLSAGAAGLAVLVTLPVSEARIDRRRPSLGAIGRLITRRDVLLPALLCAVAQYIAWATTFGFLPTLAKGLGASDAINGLLVSLSLAVGMAGNLLTGALVKRTGNMRMMAVSFLLLVSGTAVCALAQSLALIIFAQALIGLGTGICFPLCMGMSIQHVDETQRATAMGLHQAVYAIGMFAGPWLSGILAESIGLNGMFGITAAGGLALSLALGRLLAQDAASA